MGYRIEIIEKMKEIVLLASLDDSFKATLLSYIDEKKDSSMDFGALCTFHYQALVQQPKADEDIIAIAAAVELLILSFDIIDDLQDGDADYLWCRDPAMAMNAVLAMLFLTIKCIQESTFSYKEQAIQLLHDFALKSINGQYLDIGNCGKDEASYLKMIETKSGALIALSSSIGATLATGQIDARVINYSTYIGVVQQILNDIRDLKTWGKKNDLLNRRFSLPIIYLFEQPAEYADILKEYYNGTIAEIDTAYFKEVLLESGAIRYALAIKNVFKYKALDLIETMPFSSKDKEHLKALVE
ncbi:polyprenyl synthetase family protein [Metasolibacillus meyeri]|uniref:Polyprenyl synthetase family protein n=1 Tax=Metasolibacillus meyeri TaxID=1071052 RepID=A0AAW9NY72_9BACL|nr:polyprenyl synthetase family protein [Metasolibacillus meyeri]MEC1180258.1 polyprenyl synthetase family protein [Metasolibacillus meyeri]